MTAASAGYTPGCMVQLSSQTAISYDAIIIKTLPPQTMVISPLPFSDPLPFLFFLSCHHIYVTVITGRLKSHQIEQMKAVTVSTSWKS